MNWAEKLKNRTQWVLFLFVILGACQQGSWKDKETEVWEIDAKVEGAINECFILMEQNEFDAAIVGLNKISSVDIPSRQKAVVYNTLGYCFDHKGDYRKALEKYSKALAVFAEMGDSIGAAQTQVNMVTCYKIMGVNDGAVKMAMNAIRVFESNPKYKIEMAQLYNVLGSIYTEDGNYSRAMDYHKMSIKMRRSSEDEISIAPSINNIGNCYFESNQIDSALKYYTRYYALSVKSGSERKVARALLNLAKVKFKNGKFDEANALLDNAEKKCETTNYETGILAVQLIRATYNKPSLAMELEAKKAFEKSTEIGLVNEQLEALAILEKIKSSQGNAAEAYDYSKKYDNLKKKMDATVSQNRIYTYEISAQMDKNLNELKNLRNSNKIVNRDRTIQRNIIIAIIIIALFFGTYLYRRYKEKAKFVEEYFSSDTGVVLKSGKKLLFENIYRVETDRNDVVLVTDEGKIVEKSTTLKEFESNLPKIQFGKCQRGIVLNFQSVDHVRKTKLTYNGESINITPKYRDEFLAQWQNFDVNRKIVNKSQN